MKKYDLYLTTPETKTVNQGMSTKWVLGDKMNVLFAETGTTDYQRGFDFAVVDAESGKIEGRLPKEFDETLTYDWYVGYPNSSDTSPVRNMTIGIWGSELYATQTGNDSMAHLAGGRRYPLVGNVRKIPGTKHPTVRMKNVAAVIAFNVKNGTKEDIVLDAIQLKAPEVINGKFKVDFSGNTIDIAPNKKESIAKLQVGEGTPIPAGKSAKFYMGVKPFSYEVGEEVLCVVNATCGGVNIVSRITKTTDALIDFAQGTITTLNLTFSASSNPLDVNQADFDTFNQGIQYVVYDKEFVSLDGWYMKNSAANSSFIDLEFIAPTLSGKATAPGVLTSPLLANGCGTLNFKYGVFTSRMDQLSFKAEVLDEAGNTVWTKNITEENPIYGHGYDFSEEINIPGPFRLRFTNLCPTNAVYDKDCVSLYKMSWTNFQ